MTASAQGSVTKWIADLKSQRQTAAATELWNRFFRQLAALARRRLAGIPERLTDDQQAAADALYGLLRGVEQNRFPDLQDRGDLWQILLDLTEKQVSNQLQYHARLKRNWRRTVDVSAIAGEDSAGQSLHGGEQLESPEPTPEFAVACAEQYDLRLEQLDAADPRGDLRRAAIGKLQGYSNEEIAEHCSVATRTVERRLRRIRDLWSSAPPADPPSGV
jgi:DNA-directed RNA polymerase specialized sigma24 family protein